VTQAADEGVPSPFELVVPPELEGGVYANFLGSWHTAYEFTLDFAATQPARRLDPDDADSPVRVPCRVVSRVKLPATLIFDVIRILNPEMTQYENRFGEIRRPGPNETES
jgi:hypothetical protein